MEYIVKIDRQGRVVIPAPIRKALSLKGDSKAIVRLDGPRIIIEVVDKSLEKRVESWRELALSTKAELFTEDVEESWKWMSHEYAKRKLGLC